MIHSTDDALNYSETRLLKVTMLSSILAIVFVLRLSRNSDRYALETQYFLTIASASSSSKNHMRPNSLLISAFFS